MEAVRNSVPDKGNDNESKEIIDWCRCHGVTGRADRHPTIYRLVSLCILHQLRHKGRTHTCSLYFRSC